MRTNKQLILQIAVPVPAKRGKVCCYDYLALDDAKNNIGNIVKVPLGNREVWGIIISVNMTASVHEDKLKSVLLYADLPPLNDDLLRFLYQVTSWTLSSFGAVMKLMINTASALEKPPVEKIYSRSKQSEEISDKPIKLTDQRKRVFAFLQDHAPMPAHKIAEQTGVSQSVILAMEKAGLLSCSQQLKQIESADFSTKLMADRQSQLTLSDDQLAVTKAIREKGISSFHIHLLDGITGSGKTETYFDIVTDIATQGRQVLILLPEIALATSWQDRFESWFGFQPMIWHSSLSSAKRRLYWQQAIKGAPMIVVGARSALFLPLSNLGLIVVDEEHDSSFRQEEYVNYHARDMAILRAKISNIPIILASATPSLESWVNAGAWQGKNQPNAQAKKADIWHHHILDKRFGTATLPEIEIVDLRLSRPESGKWLSAELITAIAETQKAGEQSLLFLNRRGYAPMSICTDCGHKLACHQCDSLLVTHKQAGRVQCHVCGIAQNLSPDCPACESNHSLQAVGPGVERLYEEVKQRFPEANVAILSSDMVRSVADIKAFFTAVKEKEIDIIIGTQMAAKGHHFPDLTLVGIIDADLGLGGGDLRAAERTYQLLWQVAGRSGRADHKGRVLVQTFQPTHPALVAMANSDGDEPIAARDAFLSSEAEMRYQAAMPPFGRLAGIIIAGRELLAVEKMAMLLYEMRPQFARVDILGPARAPISRVKGEFRYRFLIRTDKEVDLQKIISDWLETTAKSDVRANIGGNIRVFCDIDPYNFL